MKVLLAVDLGTTGNRVIAFSKKGKPVARSYYEFPQIFPEPGWVEHDPAAIWKTTRKALKDVLAQVGAENVAAIGITNQRETTVLWDRETGIPVHNAIVWQDRRTCDICAALAPETGRIARKTGLFVDPYFSATKIKWLVDRVPGVRRKVREGRLLFGTVDTWILWKLTGGKVHATEPSNAARTMVYDIHALDYDRGLLDLFGLPREIFPEVKDSAGEFGMTDRRITGREIPVTGILGDQQASLFAHGAWKKGDMKNTYGTGLFLMAVTDSPKTDPGRLVTTVAWKIGGEVEYALEGSIFVGGSCIQWLRDGLKMIKAAPETGAMAASLSSNDGVYFVPALTGLGAPWWDPTARGTLIGLTRGTTRAHIARAALEGIAYQVRDVVEAMRALTGMRFPKLKVDGGAVKNDFLMQFQADILGMKIERPALIENTALGAAGIAGIGAGFWTRKEFLATREIDRVFVPAMKPKARNALYARWLEAVGRSHNWAEG